VCCQFHVSCQYECFPSPVRLVSEVMCRVLSRMCFNDVLLQTSFMPQRNSDIPITSTDTGPAMVPSHGEHQCGLS